MFGRSRQGGGRRPHERNRRWRRRRNHDKGHEVFTTFLRTVGNIVRGQALYFADRYRHRAADVVEDFAWSLRDVGEQRDIDGDGMPVLDDIADDLEDLSDVIRDMRLSSALAEVEYLARRKPFLFGLGALAVGYLITRAARRADQEY